ncbi:hypothetical protein BFW01_g4768 [Lasiodiplodia theobromae]|uniref:Uncharacterized protein n=2 Tax=Lasiodiplodia TaxID=66739 RepID=A0A5N5DTU9_9PEZI|nr:uncharacterized protein LTHEOB_7182 [Lasiodiplodia theobromae]KAB2579654.1 hypothetical protein DBV05_g1672 [Lasiodiplodia theobromae]KAF4542928.1 hypothetical protein LTHEOB_7182 [Lasiodiplodia theobromae]KAF9633873.1 hypothetical protein BFW01_g4768 [Lasiodiplodia theobromae]KAK0653187.1 hypothetical protein DIS24_g6203 [Lasiodiplodia hormozganensis]
MASDEDYAAFLAKANQDTGAAPSTQSIKTKAVDAEVPHVLLQVEEYYISDADEPFEPVSLKWDSDSMPSKGEFAKLIGHGSDASSLSQNEFDPKGQYAKVLDVVKQAGSQDVAIFRVQHGSTRAELYVVSLDKKGGRIVGLKAVAIES